MSAVRTRVEGEVTDDEFKNRQMRLFDEALALGTRSVLKLMFLSLIHTTIQLTRIEDRLARLGER